MSFTNLSKRLLKTIRETILGAWMLYKVHLTKEDK